ncbi:MAG: type II toxin-antitoxin system Phd/YefM family antitoxin [bacterium]
MKMKSVALRDMKTGFSDYITQAQKDYILITKHGKPAAIVWGVEGRDLEDIFYMTNRAFWTTMRKRRSQKSMPWNSAKRELGL